VPNDDQTKRNCKKQLEETTVSGKSFQPYYKEKQSLPTPINKEKFEIHASDELRVKTTLDKSSSLTEVLEPYKFTQEKQALATEPVHPR